MASRSNFMVEEWVSLGGCFELGVVDTPALKARNMTYILLLHLPHTKTK